MHYISDSVDVLVVGGGPAGLATAIAARRNGLSVVVADGAVPPIDKACGEGLMPEGVEVLHQLGVGLPETEAHPFCGVRFVNEGEAVEARFPRGPAYGIRRTRLQRILSDHAAECGVEMRWRAPVTELFVDDATAKATVGGERIRARWIVGADGTKSRVRSWARMDAARFGLRLGGEVRYGFRLHYRIAPWTEFMELYWGGECQVYVTPVGEDDVGVALISSNPKLRVEEALAEFPELKARLNDAEVISSERGGTTGDRHYRRVFRDRCVLVGDASGGVDAITGEGLALAFQQAEVLGESLATGDLARYQRLHRELSRRPRFMARMMLLLGRHRNLRRRAMRVFRLNPGMLAGLVAVHVGEGMPGHYLADGFSFAWEMLRVGIAEA